MADFLHQLSDASDVWNNISDGYNKQIVFRDITYGEIKNDRLKAKQWFQEQKQYWGRNCVRVINPWIEKNKDVVSDFMEEFKKTLSSYDDKSLR